MNVKLVLVSESGEVLDSTDLMPADEWNQARNSALAALTTLGELRRVAE